MGAFALEPEEVNKEGNRHEGDKATSKDQYPWPLHAYN